MSLNRYYDDNIIIVSVRQRLRSIDNNNTMMDNDKRF